MECEAEAVQLAARGDAPAFRSIWDAHRAAVYRFACWMLADRAAAEDATQETFLALIERPERFDSTRASLRTFLLAIARNQCRLRRRALLREAAMEEAEVAGPEAAAAFESTEAAARLNAAIAALPPLQREAIFLFEYEGLSLEESAAVAGTDVGTLKSRLHRARQRLRRQLIRPAKEKFR